MFKNILSLVIKIRVIKIFTFSSCLDLASNNKCAKFSLKFLSILSAFFLRNKFLKLILTNVYTHLQKNVCSRIDE